MTFHHAVTRALVRRQLATNPGFTIEMLARSMSMAEQGTGRQALAFQALGISPDQIKAGMSVDSVDDLVRMAVCPATGPASRAGAA